MSGNRSAAPGATMRNEDLFAFNPDASVSSVRVGQCPIVVTVADNVLLYPERVAEFAPGHPFAEDTGNLYPGLRARVPAAFSPPLRAWLTGAFHRAGVLEE